SGRPAHLGSTLEHDQFRFDRRQSTAGVVSRSDLSRLLVTGRREAYRRRAESYDHLVVEQYRKRFEVFGIGCVVPQQQISCGLVPCAPLMPQANGFPSVESEHIGLALNLDFVLDVL